MTYKEALEQLKYEIEEEGHCSYIEDEMKVAFEALEKQIPKKPIPFKRTAHDFCNGVCEHSHYPCEHMTIYNHEYQYTDYKCPLCNKRVSDGNPNNCCHCGQALDWSDAE